MKLGRSARDKPKFDNITLSVGNLERAQKDQYYITTIKSNELVPTAGIEMYEAEQEVKLPNSSPIARNNYIDTEIGFGDKEDDKTESDKYDYIQPVDSPISTEDQFDFKGKFLSEEQSSLEDIDDELNITNASI
jgi:hypothetical protein